MSEMKKTLDKLHLGKATIYTSSYDASLLSPIPRSLGREALGLSASPDFGGVDLWTAYEVSWLDNSGKPHVAIAEFVVPADSDFIVESKSLKLYLNSLNQTIYESWDAVQQVIAQDLSTCAASSVGVILYTLDQFAEIGVVTLPGVCVDDIEATFDHYLPNPELLELDEGEQLVTESLCSHLLKTNCPVTGQPDWASVLIEYRGRKINHQSILKYIVSFRDEQDFHEQCVERIYSEIMEYCRPEKLTVYARYTRRGGIDINPLRSNDERGAESLRLSRQ
jgi:7-cyano-7-deazaguanine reductase